jgi:hypothetical protein
VDNTIHFVMSNLIYCQIALGNILKFRKKNWQFDIIGGFIYFILVFSMFPQVSSMFLKLPFSYSNIFIFSYILINIYRWLLTVNMNLKFPNVF